MRTSIFSALWRLFCAFARGYKARCALLPRFAMVAVISVPTASAAVYKCASSDGSLTYSDTPCASNAQRINVQATITRVSPDIAAPLIQSAIYASQRNGRAFDVTTQLRSQCAAGSASCIVNCGNQLAGDPDFGQKKYCRIEYECTGGEPQVLRIPEGTSSTLSCTSTAQDKSARESSVILCSTTTFNAWIKAQGRPLPDPNARIAKLVEISNQCRRTLGLSDMARPAPIPTRTPGQGDAAQVPHIQRPPSNVRGLQSPAAPPVLIVRHIGPGPAPVVTIRYGSSVVDPERNDAIYESRRLLGLIGVYTPAPQDSASATAQALPGIATLLVRRLEPNDANWSPRSPQWACANHAVSSNIREDVVPLLADQAEQKDRLVATVASRTEPRDVEALLRFFGSPEGRSYLAFQKDLNAIYVGGIRMLLQHLQTRQSIHQPQDQALLARRLQTLGLSSNVIAMQLDARAVQKAGGDVSGHAGDIVLFAEIAVLQGRSLDDVAATYAQHLAAFRAFNESALGQRFYGAILPALNAEAASNKAALAAFIGTEEFKYRSRWVNACGIVSVPAPPLPEVARARAHLPTPPPPPRMVVASDPSKPAVATITCVETADAAYVRAHHPLPDNAVQVAALRAMISKCRKKFGLPPISTGSP